MAKVLIIEDDEVMLKAIETVLKRDGHEVLTARDGREAIKKIEESRYDVVLTDLMMPYATGLELVSKIRENDKNVGIIIISTIGNEDSIMEAFNLGADDYLKKPIMAGELLIRIRKLIKNKILVNG